MRKKYQKPKIPPHKRSFSKATKELGATSNQAASAWLIFSREEKAFARKLFKDSGFNIALNDNGRPIPYTVVATSEGELKSLLRRYDDSEVVPVQSLRIVQAMHGEPANQSKWREWGYKPKKNPELSCVKHA